MTERKTSDHQVAVIGAGAIGSAVARRLLAHGHDVVVWNRTPSRLDPLVAAGARPAGSVGEAVSSATLALLTLTDYVAATRGEGRWLPACLPGGLAQRPVPAVQ